VWKTCSEGKASREIVYDLLLFRFFEVCFIPSNEDVGWLCLFLMEIWLLRY